MSEIAVIATVGNLVTGAIMITLVTLASSALRTFAARVRRINAQERARAASRPMDRPALDRRLAA